MNKDTRRAFLWSAGGIAGAVGAYEAYDRLTTTEAERIFQEFPSSVPGIAHVLKEPVRGAKHCLVHVGQLHAYQGMEPWYQELSMSVQERIYEALTHLQGRIGVRAVYDEGISPQSLQVHQRMVRFTREVKAVHSGMTVEDLRRLARLRKEDIEATLAGMRKHKDLPPQLDETKLLERELALLSSDPSVERLYEYLDRVAISTGAMLGAAGILEADGKLELRISEDADLVIAGVRENMTTGKIGPNSQRREDHLLSLIAQRDEPLALTVYGSSHCWLDNIRAWNAKHPDKRFSLIELEPPGIQDYYELLPNWRHPPHREPLGTDRE